jgi:hypothetical protein
MALFGSLRDISTFKGITREVMEDVISQSVGYYKIVLSDTKANSYGEAINKTYIGPVLITCLISRGDYEFSSTELGPDNARPVEFRFFRDHLVDANVVPEVGDVVLYNESYYLIDSLNENQLILGKDNQYAYEDGLDKFGSSYSIILTGHYASPDSLGIKQNRL